MEENNFEQPVNPKSAEPIAEQPEKPKKGKTGLIIAIILVAIAALSVGGFFLFKNLFTSPKQCIAKGMEKLQQEMAARPHPVLDELGMDELTEYYESNAYDFDSSINLKLEEMDDEM